MRGMLLVYFRVTLMFMVMSMSMLMTTVHLHVDVDVDAHVHVDDASCPRRIDMHTHMVSVSLVTYQICA